MKRAVALIILIAAGFAGGVLWMKQRGAPPPGKGEEPAAPSATAEAGKPKISVDTNGHTVITLSAKLRGDLGLVLTNVAPFKLNPELKGYGRVLDPAPLGLLVTELGAAQAAYAASSNDLARLKTLEAQGNASARALQAAEAAALRDEGSVQSAKERLTLSWGQAVAGQKDLLAFAHALGALETALVRVDLPLGQTLDQPPDGARIATLSDRAAEAEFLEPAPSVDPQMQGQGFLFLLNTNSLRLTPGEAVVGYLKLRGDPLLGALVPRDAVVRTEGEGWAYVLNASGESFTRTEVPLDRPTDAGWFVAQGVSAGSSVVILGAQQLLSFELKGAGAEE